MKNSISIANNGWRWFSFTMKHSKVNLQYGLAIGSGERSSARLYSPKAAGIN